MADNGLLNNPNLYGDDMADVKKPAASLFRELGIETPQEKQAAQMEQQQLMQALQQRQQMAMQQMAIQKAQMAGGFNFPALTAMGANTPQTPPGGGFLGLKQAPQPGVPGQMGGMQEQSDDPSQILSAALQANPTNRGRALKQAGYQLLQLAIKKGDGNMQSIASNMLMKGQQFDQDDSKEQAQTEDFKSQTQTRNQKAGLELAQAGNPGTPFQTTDAQGNEVTKRDTKNALGQVVGERIEGRGPKKITQTNIDGGLNSAGVSKNVDEFGKLLQNSDSTVVGMRRISQLLDQGAGQGWAAKGVGFVNNIKGLAEQIGSGATLSAGAEQALANKKGDFQAWATKTAISQADWSDLVSSLAKTYNPTGTITEKDITRAAEAVGAGLTNVSSVKAVLKEGENRVYKNVDATYRNSNNTVQGFVKGQYEGFNGRFGHKAPVFVKTPDEARKVPKGTPFINEQGEEFSNGS